MIITKESNTAYHIYFPHEWVAPITQGLLKGVEILCALVDLEAFLCSPRRLRLLSPIGSVTRSPAADTTVTIITGSVITAMHGRATTLLAPPKWHHRIPVG